MVFGIYIALHWLVELTSNDDHGRKCMIILRGLFALLALPFVLLFIGCAFWFAKLGLFAWWIYGMQISSNYDSYAAYAWFLGIPGVILLSLFLLIASLVGSK